MATQEQNYVFTVGSKMDMALDDVIKQTKKEQRRQVKETTTRKTGGARNQSFTKAISKRSTILRKSKVDKMRGVESTVSPDQQLKKQNKKIRSAKTKFSDASWAKQQRQRTQWQKRKLVNLTVSSTGNPKKKKQQTQKQTKPQDIKISVNSNTNQPRRTRANLQGGITKRTKRVIKNRTSCYQSTCSDPTSRWSDLK